MAYQRMEPHPVWAERIARDLPHEQRGRVLAVWRSHFAESERLWEAGKLHESEHCLRNANISLREAVAALLNIDADDFV